MRQLCKLHPHLAVGFDFTLSVIATPLLDSVATMDNDYTFFFCVPTFFMRIARMRCL